MLQILTSFLYQWVSTSWTVSLFVLPWIIVLHLAKLFYDEKITFQHFEETVVRYSRIVVLAIVVVGLVANFAGFQAEPPLKLFSQFVALFYFGFLFWRF